MRLWSRHYKVSAVVLELTMLLHNSSGEVPRQYEAVVRLVAVKHIGRFDGDMRAWHIEPLLERSVGDNVGEMSGGEGKGGGQGGGFGGGGGSLLRVYQSRANFLKSLSASRRFSLCALRTSGRSILR